MDTGLKGDDGATGEEFLRGDIAVGERTGEGERGCLAGEEERELGERVGERGVEDSAAYRLTRCDTTPLIDDVCGVTSSALMLPVL